MATSPRPFGASPRTREGPHPRYPDAMPITPTVVAALLALGSRTLHVGPGREYPTPSAAAAVAQDGDQVLIDGGDYHADVAVWRAGGLRIARSDQSAPVRLFADGQSAEGKAIWVLKGADTTVSGVEFIGCEVPDNNGAGIRLEGPGLTIEGCTFRDNQTGILTGAHDQSDVVIERCEFVGNGAGDGLSHNIYIGHVRSLTMRASWSHDARIGHTLKSRAAANTIVCNRFADEQAGTSSYLIDIPNGGDTLIMGNQLLQGAQAENGTVISYGREGLSNEVNRLCIAQNTVVSDRYCEAAVRTQDGLESALLANNIVVGAGSILAGPGTVLSNVEAQSKTEAGVDPISYALVPGSPAINAGADLSGFDPAFIPHHLYRHPLAIGVRRNLGVIDVGAYELTPRAIRPRP